MNNKTKMILVAVAVIILVTLFIFWKNGQVDWSKVSAGTLKFGETIVLVEVANTPELRMQGLSGRDPLDENEGMLFVFDTPQSPEFWMKDMNFPIDIIYFNDDWVTVDIKENFEPETYPETYSPKEKSKYVVEVSSGFTKRHNWTIGSKTKFEAY